MVLSAEYWVITMLSEDGPLPKSMMRDQDPLLSDLHQVAKVRPVVPVVKELIFMYWLLVLERTSWLLLTVAPFSKDAS
jgi:hypothetical protein